MNMKINSRLLAISIQAAVSLFYLSASTKAAESGEKSSGKGPLPATVSAEIDTALPSMEVLLQRALSSSPRIVASRSKVVMAEAELAVVQLEVAKEVIALWNEWASQRRVVQGYKAAKRTSAELLAAQANIATIEAQLPYLLGRRPSSPADSLSTGMASHRIPPSGPVVDKIRDILPVPSDIDFVDTPLQDVMDYLGDVHGVDMVVDKNGLSEVGMQDLRVSLTLKGSSFLAKLQAMEDVNPGLVFVVRDYGILATARDSAAAANGMPVQQFLAEVGKVGTQTERSGP